MPIHEQLQAVAAKLGATAYQISQLIAAEADPTEKQRQSIEKRWQRWLKGERLKTIQDMQEHLSHLGYEIVIKKKRGETK